MSAPAIAAARRLNLAGVLLLVTALLAAAAIHVAAARATARDAAAGIDSTQLDASPRELRELERLGGRAAVSTYQFHRWLTSLWRGKRLAYSVAVIGLLSALGCFYVAGLMAESVEPE